MNKVVITAHSFLIFIAFLYASPLIASGNLPFQITCAADLYRVDRQMNVIKNSLEMTAPFVVRDPVLANSGESKFTIKFQSDYELEFDAQASAGQSPWEDGSNTVFVNSSLIRIEPNGSRTVLAFQQGSSDDLNAKWKVKGHGQNAILETFLYFINTEIQTATLKASKELGKDVSGMYTVLIENGYIANGMAQSVFVRCTLPRK